MGYYQGNLLGDSLRKLSLHFDIHNAWRDFPRTVSRQ